MVLVCRPGLFPADRRRPDPASRSRSRRHPHRKHRGDIPGGRGQDPRSHSGKGPRSDHRQYRAAGASLQSGIRRRFDDRDQRWCHPGGAQGGPQADRRLRQEIASGAARRIPGGRILFPGGRHRDADFELRTAGADRRPDRGFRHRTIFRLQRSSVNALPRFPASSTRICSRKSTRRPSTPRSTGPGPRSLASMPARWPPTSMSA